MLSNTLNTATCALVPPSQHPCTLQKREEQQTAAALPRKVCQNESEKYYKAKKREAAEKEQGLKVSKLSKPRRSMIGSSSAWIEQIYFPYLCSALDTGKNSAKPKCDGKLDCDRIVINFFNF